MAITKQDVWRVANEIDAAGDKPTAVEVRKRLGTGSYTTITAALKEWTRPEDEDDGSELEPMPEEFQERIAQAGADLFAIAMRIAGEQAQAEREAWAAERAALEAERDGAIAIADQVAAELDEARRDIAQLHAENATVVRERGEAYAVAEERRHAAAKAQDEAQGARSTADKLRGRVEALEAVIEALKPNRKNVRAGGDKSSAPGAAAVTNSVEA